MDNTITEFISSFTTKLKAIGYSERAIYSYKPVLNGLLQYCKNNSIETYSPAVGEAYFTSKFPPADVSSPLSVNIRKYIRVLNMLNTYQAFHAIPFRCKRSKYTFPLWFQPIYGEFLEYRKYIGIQDYTIKKQHYCFEKFAQYLDNNGIHSFEDIGITDLQNYIALLSVFSLSVRYNMVSAVRMLMQFLYERKYIEMDYKSIIPNVKYSHDAHIPSVYSQDEIQRLLNCVDRGNATGQRDYVILLLAARYGLRAADICGLTFDEIDWENSCIHISQQKTCEPLSLPLSGEIGNAIIEYIKYGRPKTEYRNVFVRHISPVQPINSSSLHCMIQRYFTAAHIDTKTRKHGPHALRHSLASNMLLNNTPLPTISQALGHSSTSSTQIYLKIDTKNLTMCALPLIEEEDSL